MNAPIDIVRAPIAKESLKKFMGHPFETLIKFVADISLKTLLPFTNL